MCFVCVHFSEEIEHLVFFVLCFPLKLHPVAHTKECVMALRRTQTAAGMHTNVPVSFMELHLLQKGASFFFFAGIVSKSLTFQLLILLSPPWKCHQSPASWAVSLQMWKLSDWKEFNIFLLLLHLQIRILKLSPWTSFRHQGQAGFGHCLFLK